MMLIRPQLGSYYQNPANLRENILFSQFIEEYRTSQPSRCEVRKFFLGYSALIARPVARHWVLEKDQTEPF